MTFDKAIEKLALPAVVATFIVVPLGAWLYDGVYLPSRNPKGAKVFTLYWSAEKGITQKRINGWNYWQPRVDPVKELRVRKGDRVVLRLISADVHHGMALPAFGILDAVIHPGDVTRAEFVADKVGSFKFFCTIRCGSMHDNMSAILTVLPSDADDTAVASTSRPEVLQLVYAGKGQAECCRMKTSVALK